jgi:hypothetical protein
VLAEQGKSKEAVEAFRKLESEGTPSYRMLAKFREAGQLAQSDSQGDRKQAVRALRSSSPATPASDRQCRILPPCEPR